MKKLLHHSVLCFLIAILIPLTACDEDQNGDDIHSERFQLLTAHTWNFDTIFTICQDPEIIWFIDWIAETWPGTTKSYRSDGSFALTGPDGTAFESGKWEFSNGESEIITFDEDDPSDILGHVRIDVLTDEDLELTDLIDVPVSDTCYVTMNWVN